MARGTRTPQRGRCVSGMELTRKRHAVVGVLTGLSFRVPYQPKIGTETQCLKDRTKHLCISLQGANFLFAPRGSASIFLNPHTPELGISRTHFLHRTPERPHPTYAAFTIEPRKQGEGEHVSTHPRARPRSCKESRINHLANFGAWHAWFGDPLLSSRDRRATNIQQDRKYKVN
jgi:hypothetical protein